MQNILNPHWEHHTPSLSSRRWLTKSHALHSLIILTPAISSSSHPLALNISQRCYSQWLVPTWPVYCCSPLLPCHFFVSSTICVSSLPTPTAQPLGSLCHLPSLVFLHSLCCHHLVLISLSLCDLSLTSNFNFLLACHGSFHHSRTGF